MGYSTKYQSGSALSSALGVADDSSGLNYGAPPVRRAPNLSAYAQYTAGRLGTGDAYWRALQAQLGQGALDHFGGALTEGAVRGMAPYQAGAGATEAAVRGVPYQPGVG